LASATVIPTWLLARVLVGPRLALVPAFLSIAGAWMMITAFIISDNLAYPLATASFACTVTAVRDTRVRWVIGSGAFATLAVLTRTQLLVLPVILVVALAVDVIRQPRGERVARIEARPRALWAVLGVGVVALVAVSVAVSSLSSYDILSHDVTPGDALAAAGEQGVAVINMLAVVPVVAAAALAARAVNWRDEVSGPLLVTLCAAVVVLLPVVGLFETYARRGRSTATRCISRRCSSVRSSSRRGVSADEPQSVRRSSSRQQRRLHRPSKAASNSPRSSGRTSASGSSAGSLAATLAPRS
jgi:hypothetical protein